ncbi:MAG: hypothetical protein DRI54_05185 [Bacteroidetes bacterium]|nr:MAG: hypothetical protein DRI54_05185 [Bacteroidota bacterium]
MNPQQFLDEILPIINSVKEDKIKLEKIHRFLIDEIYEEPSIIKIPEKYKPLIADIADSIGSEMICYVNVDTFEMEMLPKLLLDDPLEYESMTGESFETMNLMHPGWKNSIEIEPLESHESFKIMEGFVDHVPDLNLHQNLINALNHKKPFANFKNLIDDSAYRQDWFDYRQQWLEEYVYGLLEDAIGKREKSD